MKAVVRAAASLKISTVRLNRTEQWKHSQTNCFKSIVIDSVECNNSTRLPLSVLEEALLFYLTELLAQTINLDCYLANDTSLARHLEYFLS